MVIFTFLSTLSLILMYIGIVLFGCDTWYGIAAVLIGALMFVMFYTAGMDKEDKLINRINELEKYINQINVGDDKQ